MLNFIWSLLSRKLVLSLIIIALGIWFICIKLITEQTFTWIIMSTAVSYVVGKGIDMVNNAVGKVSFATRISSLFNREFLVAVGVIILMSVLLKYGKITDSSWSLIIMTIGPVYNITNPLAKGNHGL